MRHLSFLTTSVLGGLAFATLTPASAAQGLEAQLVTNGLAAPLFAGSPEGDFDRIFICEQNTARIRVIRDGNLLATPFLDIGAQASQSGERGLLGLAFHPDYLNNGRFFVNYTDNSGNTQVVEYLASPPTADVADPTPVQTIISIGQPYSNHNGGWIGFSPLDGKLYIGTGDGGSAGDPACRAQRGDSLLGKMLRLDIDISAPFIPSDNPFLGDGTIRDEIWAFGLRNPWRCSFDRATGDLYMGDVGQNAIEEVSWQSGASTGGENYGWKIMEGLNCYSTSSCPSGVLPCNDPGLTLPIHQYNHSGNGCSITGGYVYRGSAMPELQGTYFFGDYCTSRIWSFRWDGATLTEFTDRTAELEPPGTPTINNITSFGEDAAGELYICDPSGGELFKIVPACGSTNYCTSEANSAYSSGAIMSSAGSTSIAANNFSLVVALAVPNQNGLFFYGPEQIDVPFGDGHLCVGPGSAGLFRLNPPQTLSSFGDATRHLDFTAPPANGGPGMILPGSTWNAQFWFRDPAGPGGSGFNTSDGLSVLFCL